MDDFLDPERFHKHGRMCFSLQIRTGEEWLYLKGEWNSQTVYEWLQLVHTGTNLTNNIADARKWRERGIVRPSGPSAIDRVARSLVGTVRVRLVTLGSHSLHIFGVREFCLRPEFSSPVLGFIQDQPSKQLQTE